ncbi:MAG: FtsX-like permease family protein, partial [Bryobacteraceae bacterium]
VGLYGVMSYLVRWRSPEIGIRLAIGARPRDIRRMVLRQSLKVILAGVAVGSASSLWLDRVLRGLLYDVSSTDPVAFAVAIAFLSLTGLAAAYRPAREASRVDPMIALRLE